MTRYDAQGIETEFEPGSRRRVLHNSLGIRSAREMSRTESAMLLQAQDRLIETFSPDHRFAAVDICGMHRTWLGSIYAWAGNYRGVNINRGGFHFAAATQIPRLMVALERDVLACYTPCQHTNHDKIANALAVTHAELILIHPFREGNGRCARLLALLMGLQAGLPPLDFSPLSGKGKRNYIAAIHAAVDANYAPMRAIFRAVVRRSLLRYDRQGR